MPTYDYKCTSCDHIQEEFHNINEKPEIKCEKCGSLMKKTVSPFNFHIKGGGTRSRTWQQRHGHKVGESQPTPTESAAAKASDVMKEAEHKKKLKNDPYYQHRD